MSIGRVHKSGSTDGAYCIGLGVEGLGEQQHLLSVGVK